ncbi:hypothetical protein [Nostoc sp.]
MQQTYDHLSSKKDFCFFRSIVNAIAFLGRFCHSGEVKIEAK